MGLTVKQELFCKTYLETGNASEAYRQAYNAEKMSPKTVTEAASRLLKNSNVAARVDSLTKETQDLFLWDRQTSIKTLATIARSDNEAAASRISAVKELNVMHGYNLPVKGPLLGPDGAPARIKVTISFVAPEEREI